jgi:hypothetical protein
VRTPEEQKEVSTLKALASDISEGLNEVHVKRSASNQKRAAFKVFKSLAFGDNVKKSRAKKSLGKIIHLNEKSISDAIKTRESILKGNASRWLYTKRKVRRDALSEEDGKKIFNYWTHTASRPTGDKKDVIKERIGKKQDIRHPKHVLEKTQTETFLEFQDLHPEVKVKQRKFESLKPFFVRQAKERNRRSCLCRKLVETQIVFTACMEFRKDVLKLSTSNTSSEHAIILKTATEAVEKTLCLKTD